MTIAFTKPSVFRGSTPVMGRLVPLMTGATLLYAVGLEWYQFIHLPLFPPGPLRISGFEIALISCETFLGLWLISGAMPMAARRVAIGCFSVFACYTFYEALAGKTDCGCFGQVHVNPWVTFILDVAIVLVLVFLAKPPATPSQWSQRKWPMAVAAAIGLAAGVTVAILHPKVVSAANGLVTVESGNIVILEPHKWIGHKLPVLKDIVVQGTGKPLDQRLAFGQWIVMFYHTGCDECRHTIPVYEALAQREVMSGKTPHVAFIRVPSDPPNPEPPGLFDSRLTVRGTLASSHQWFATTPIIVELRNGIVHRIATGLSAMNLDWCGTMNTDH